MSFLKSEKRNQNVEVLVPVLVRFWSEDGVWNASAMDIPVAVFGESFEDARTHFEEALLSHFEILCERNQIESTLKILVRAVKDRGFYERIQPRQTFEKFVFNSQELCLV